MTHDSRTRAQPFSMKERFATHHRALLGEDYERFITCNNTYLRRAIRINTLKADPEHIRERLTDNGWELTPVPWAQYAYWIQGERLDIGNLLEHQLGYVYVQDPASMLPPIILQPQPHERVLDLCASPGSKTSQAAALMQNTGIIVANDVDSTRLIPLGANLQRLGVLNAAITRTDGRMFKTHTFDKVIIDAPCSGTGTIRRSPKAITLFNPNAIKKLARLQTQLLTAGYAALAPGGALTYSTCTLEPEENEGVISEFLEHHPDAQLEPVTLNIARERPYTTHPITGKTYHADVTRCLRIHPYTNDTEGFFVAHMTKPA